MVHTGENVARNCSASKMIEYAMNLQSHYLWNGCFEDRDQVCDHSQLAVIFKATEASQGSNKMAIRRKKSAVSFWLNLIKLPFTYNSCCRTAIELQNDIAACQPWPIMAINTLMVVARSTTGQPTTTTTRNWPQDAKNCNVVYLTALWLIY